MKATGRQVGRPGGSIKWRSSQCLVATALQNKSQAPTRSLVLRGINSIRYPSVPRGAGGHSLPFAKWAQIRLYFKNCSIVQNVSSLRPILRKRRSRRGGGVLYFVFSRLPVDPRTPAVVKLVRRRRSASMCCFLARSGRTRLGGGAAAACRNVPRAIFVRLSLGLYPISSQCFQHKMGSLSFYEYGNKAQKI